MRKIFIYGLITFSTFWSPLFADSLRNTITSGVTEVIPGVLSANKNFSYAQIAKQVQFWIFVFIGLIAVAYIIYIGAKLLWAPGSMEEMTKSLVSLAYVVVGLALIPFAYFLVNFIIHIRL